MEHPFDFKERRRYPRVSINLPLEYRQSHNSPPAGGLVSNVSQMGMLIHSIKDIPIGSQFKTMVFFSDEFKLDGFRAVAKVIWKDYHFEPDWKGYKYGLQFIRIFEQDRRKLFNVLGSPSILERVPAKDNVQFTNPPPATSRPPRLAKAGLNEQRRSRRKSLRERIRTRIFRLS